MADFFGANGVRAVAVHAGESSAPRSASLEALSAGSLDIVFAVDMFNEGVDLPNLDTVMMLRPTESRVLWLQQFGRGLRKAEDKERLTVIDYIGNHRTFLLGTQTLLGLGTDRSEVLHALEQLKAGEFELPPGCEVTYDLAAIDILKAVVGPGVGALDTHYKEFLDLHGVRPTAAEMYHEGYNPRSARKYEDRFLTTDSFQWQSQNRTTQASLHGQNIRYHDERGIDVHLFVRAESKTAHGRAAPFVYCGDVDFVSCKGDHPITVTWRLRETMPERLRKEWRSRDIDPRK